MEEFEKLSQLIKCIAKIKYKVKKEVLKQYNNTEDEEFMKQLENKTLTKLIRDLGRKGARISLKKLVMEEIRLKKIIEEKVYKEKEILEAPETPIRVELKKEEDFSVEGLQKVLETNIRNHNKIVTELIKKGKLSIIKAKKEWLKEITREIQGKEVDKWKDIELKRNEIKSVGMRLVWNEAIVVAIDYMSGQGIKIETDIEVKKERGRKKEKKEIRKAEYKSENELGKKRKLELVKPYEEIEKDLKRIRNNGARIRERLLKSMAGLKEEKINREREIEKMSYEEAREEAKRRQKIERETDEQIERLMRRDKSDFQAEILSKIFAEKCAGILEKKIADSMEGLNYMKESMERIERKVENLKDNLEEMDEDRKKSRERVMNGRRREKDKEERVGESGENRKLNNKSNGVNETKDNKEKDEMRKKDDRSDGENEKNETIENRKVDLKESKEEKGLLGQIKSGNGKKVMVEGSDVLWRNGKIVLNDLKEWKEWQRKLENTKEIECTKWWLEKRLYHVGKKIFELNNNVEDIVTNGRFDVLKISNENALGEVEDSNVKEIRLISKQKMEFARLRKEEEKWKNSQKKKLIK